jgi:5-formyltetrahydrofolate cyclo-ligase
VDYESKRLSKEEIRQKVWDRLEKENLARFPRPVYGRIPNFVGAENAALRLAEVPEFVKASTVKVNPDSPQRKVREIALVQRKVLLMPAPRLKSGFMILRPERVKGKERLASSIKGAFSLGEEVGLDRLPRPDVLVVGSVAVGRDGSRIGKGEGYSEIEYAILRELGLVEEEVPICTTVHPVQVLKEVPQDPYDVSMDYIVTPEEVIATRSTRKRPEGILWDTVSKEMLDEMPVLADLKKRKLS